MSVARYLEHEQDEAIKRRARQLQGGRAKETRARWFTFPAANTKADLAHGLDAVPDGYEIVWSDASVHASPGEIPTRDLIYLQADAAKARALIIFYTLRETPDERDVNE